MLYSLLRAIVALTARDRRRIRVRLSNDRRVRPHGRVRAPCPAVVARAFARRRRDGVAVSNVEAFSQMLAIPQLLLVLLSTGMAPADSFPDWLGRSCATNRFRR